MQQLFQENPRAISTYTLHKNRSFTDSRESYQHGACKKTLILRRNDRIPTQEFVLHFLKELPSSEIREYRKKIFRVLEDNGLEAVANLELTRGKNGKPNNCVHSHILTDDQRSEPELRKLLEMACERQGLVKDNDFCITFESLYDGYWRFNYFTKYGEKHFYNVILFEKNIGLNKFYTIGKWFHKPQVQIWDDIKTFMRNKDGSDPDKSGVPDMDDEFLSNEPLQELDGGQAWEWDSTDDEVPLEFGEYTDKDREALREEFGINLDKVANGNKLLNYFHIPGVGRFYKHSDGIWGCYDELPNEPVEKINAKIIQDTACQDTANGSKAPDKRIPKIARIKLLKRIDHRGWTRTPNWHKRPSVCLPPRKIYRDRRREWQRYKYNIAFRQ